MNYFFAIKNEFLNCFLTIPRFKNSQIVDKNYLLYSAKIFNNQWLIEEKCSKKNSDFFFLENEELDNSQIFFLAKKEHLSNNKYFIELKNLNSFTDTMPDFRSNLKIEIKDKGFSSYQSDYPYNLCKKKGSIISPISILLEKNADKNYFFFKNIYIKPVKEEFYIYFINLKKKIVLEKKKVITNHTNQIEIESKFINSDTYIFSDKFLGVPIYVSIKNNHISMEHTHPPHLYIWGNDKFTKVTELKNKINEIIIKKNL